MDLRNADLRGRGILVELFGGLGIVVAGAAVAALVSDRFASPASEVVIALVVASVAVAGLAWIRRFDSNVRPGWSSSLAGLGGAVGFLAFEFLVGGYAAVGAGLGAAVFAAGGILVARRSLDRSG